MTKSERDILRQSGHRHGACLHHGQAHEQDHAAWSRRDFLTRMGLAAAGTVLTVGNHTVRAFGQSRLLGALQQSGSDRILILIQMNGGNDGLNMVVPVENDIYYNNRPTIAIPKKLGRPTRQRNGTAPGDESARESVAGWSDGQWFITLDTRIRRAAILRAR